jgi:hypothetical protein
MTHLSHLPAICVLASRFPSLKRVEFLSTTTRDRVREVSSAILDMVNTSKSIEAVDGWLFHDETQQAAVQIKCRTNRCRNEIRDHGVLTDPIPISVWPLLLRRYSNEPAIIFYLLQEMHATIIPTA